MSGQISLDGDGNLVGRGDLRAQTKQVFGNIRMILEATGGSFDDVVKLTHYVVGLKPEDRPVITEVRNTYVNQANPPASTMIGVPALVMEDLLIEVEAVAVVDETRARGFSKVQGGASGKKRAPRRRPVRARGKRRARTRAERAGRTRRPRARRK